MALAGKLPDCKEAVIVVRYQELRLDIRQRDEPDLREWIVLIEAGRTLDGNHHFVF